MQLKNILFIIIFSIVLQSCKSTEAIQQKNALAVEVLTLLKTLDKANDKRLVVIANYLQYLHFLEKDNFPNALTRLKKIQNSVSKKRQNARRKAKLYLKKNREVTLFITELFIRVDADKSIKKDRIYIESYNVLQVKENQINVLIKEYNIISKKSKGNYKKYSTN